MNDVNDRERAGPERGLSIVLDRSRLPTLPDLISIFRLVASPLLIVAAVTSVRPAFVVLLVLAVASDGIDGMVARARRQCTPRGARLDSAADVALQLSAPLAMLILYPELRSSEIATTAAILLSYLLPISAGLLKFGRLAAYHTFLFKLGAFVLAAGAAIWIAVENAWLLRGAAIVLVVAALDELTITALLREPHTDVSSTLTALELRRHRSRTLAP